MKKKFLYLCLVSLLIGFVACSNDDEDNREKNIKETIVGRWRQTYGASLNGRPARLDLHLKADGTGCVVFKTTDNSSDIKVSYSDITYSLAGDQIEIKSNTNDLNGTFTLSKSYDSSIALKNVKTSQEYMFYKSRSDSELLEYYWKVKLSNSDTKNYYLFDFKSSTSGTQRYVKTSSSDYEDFNFTYTFDYENGPLSISYSNGETADYFYSVHSDMNLLLFSKKSDSNSIYYTVLTRVAK